MVKHYCDKCGKRYEPISKNESFDSHIISIPVIKEEYTSAYCQLETDFCKSDEPPVKYICSGVSPALHYELCTECMMKLHSFIKEDA